MPSCLTAPSWPSQTLHDSVRVLFAAAVDEARDQGLAQAPDRAPNRRVVSNRETTVRERKRQRR
jgi:hypothetical protein